jgi:phosphoribosylanthranilate isomerase
MSVRVKVCGITRVEDALSAIKYGADAIGFVFWAKSARYVTPEQARLIAAEIPAFISIVGVYVDPTPEWVQQTTQAANLTLCQFHGNESAAFCEQFALPYIKAIRVREGLDLLQYAQQHQNATSVSCFNDGPFDLTQIVLFSSRCQRASRHFRPGFVFAHRR